MTHVNSDYRQYFQDHIFERGIDYYLNQTVIDMSFDGEILDGLVEGEQLYHVQIKIVKNEPVACYCSCPYAASGENCKHMAALLLAWEANLNRSAGERKIPGESDEEDHPLQTRSLAELVQNSDEKLVRKYLFEILEEDEGLEQRFRRILIQQEIGVTQEQIRLKLQQLINSYTEEDGYVAEEDLDDLFSELFSYLHHEIQGLLDDQKPVDAFECVVHLMEMVSVMDAEWYVYNYWNFDQECYNMLETIIQEADSGSKERLFQWLSDRLDHSNQELSQAISNLWNGSFDEPHYWERKLVISERLAEDSRMNGRSIIDGENEWAILHLQLLRQMGASTADLLSYARRFWDEPKIRSFMAVVESENQEFDKAEAILRESLVLDLASKVWLTRHHLMLKKIFHQSSQLDSYREELLILLKDFLPGDSTLIQELKTEVSEAEWRSLRRDMIERVPDYGLQASLFCEEEMWEELSNVVFRTNDIHLLRKYDLILIDRYQEQVLEKYSELLREMARTTSNRGYYREIAEFISYVSRLPGGWPIAGELLELFQRTYRNRRAMMDELRRVIQD